MQPRKTPPAPHMSTAGPVASATSARERPHASADERVKGGGGCGPRALSFQLALDAPAREAIHLGGEGGGAPHRVQLFADPAAKATPKAGPLSPVRPWFGILRLVVAAAAASSGLLGK